jgi:hypothetical protein
MATGGEHLGSSTVTGLPLNKRDFSQLLLLASGTETDTNGAANFTQQFVVNGQRGTAAVFAMDGNDSIDPELGGATFSNFNVDAIREVRADSGVLPAEVGHGAGSVANIITKSGTNSVAARCLNSCAMRLSTRAISLTASRSLIPAGCRRSGETNSGSRTA